MSEEDLIEIKIPLIVTADGYWAASGTHQTMADKDPDWAWIDEMCDHDNPTVCPQRYWVTAYVKRPKVADVPGVAVRESPQDTKND